MVNSQSANSLQTLFNLVEEISPIDPINKLELVTAMRVNIKTGRKFSPESSEYLNLTNAICPGLNIIELF